MFGHDSKCSFMFLLRRPELHRLLQQPEMSQNSKQKLEVLQGSSNGTHFGGSNFMQIHGNF